MIDGFIIVGLLIVVVLQIVWRPRKDRQEQETLEKLFAEMQHSFERIEKNFREDFRLNREESRLVAKDNREELAASMRAFQESFERGIASFNQLQKEKFEALDRRQQEWVNHAEKRLEEIRQTVDEKLQQTLNERISQSFRLVNEQLVNVQKGLGEMQFGARRRWLETGVEQRKDTRQYWRDSAKHVVRAVVGSGAI